MSDVHEAFYGLPEEVKFCKRCVISNQRPSSTVEFKNEDLASVLKVLKSTLDLTIRKEGNKLYISGDGC